VTPAGKSIADVARVAASGVDAPGYNRSGSFGGGAFKTPLPAPSRAPQITKLRTRPSRMPTMPKSQFLITHVKRG